LNVLLVNGNVTRCARSGYGPTPAPAGLASLAGVLRRNGHSVWITQAASHVLPQDEESLPALRRELEAILARFSPDLIGISARNIGAARRPANPLNLLQYHSVFYDARLVRAFRMLTTAAVVMGGPAFSIEPRLYTKHAAPDFGLIGEAEESLLDLVEALEEGREPCGTKGLVEHPFERSADAVCCNQVGDLSFLGVGACDTTADFRSQYYEDGGFAPIQTKRGCAMNCIYCTTPWLEGNRYRFRPMNQVLEEMKRYQETWDVKHFFFVDSTFNHPPGHAMEVCDAILEAGLQVQWFAEVTPSTMDDKMAHAMKTAGCMGVTLTPDSCSEQVLKAYEKGFAVAEVANAVAVLKRHSIPFDTCLIVGGPGETRDTLAESIAFCSEHLANDVVRFCDGMVVTARSKAYDIAVSEGLIDPSVSYEELVSRNDFRGLKSYQYYFPHIKEGRSELLQWAQRVCAGKRWLLTSKDYIPDPQTGELALRPEVHTVPGARPWWRDLVRSGALKKAAS